MAKKPSITTIASGYQSTATLNNNFTNVRDAFDNTLSLDGSTPNAMQADLDMNSYDILNANSITTDTLTVDGVDITVVNEVKLNIADITTVANNITDVNTVAADIYGVTNVSNAIDNGDLINDVYQGAHSADPTLRLNSNPLQNGDIYFNTNTTRLRSYANGTWYDTGAGGNTDAALVTYLQAGTGALVRTAEARLRDVISALDFMSDAKRTDALNRTGLYDHSAEIVAACNAGIAQNKAVYFPGGQYNFGATGQLRATALTFSLASNQTLHVFGDGPGNTVFKEAAGQNAVIGRFDYMWYINTAIGVTANAVILRDFTIDKNGASNGPPPTTYAWEQSHCISIAGLYSSAAASGAFQNVVIENVDTVDKVGGGIVLAGGAILSATVRNCHGRNFSNLFGERGDLEFQATIQNFIIDSCTGSNVQSEPNVSTPFLALEPVVATFIACRYKIYDLLGFDGDQDAQTFNLINCETVDDGEIWLRGGFANISGGRLGAPNLFDWRIASSKVNDCTIVVNVDVATNAFKPFYISNVSNLAPYRQEHVFTNCKFVAASTANASTTGYAFISSSSPATSVYNCQFIDCEFSTAFQHTAECYRGGTFVFRNCKIVSRAGAWAIRAGSDNANISDITIDNCDLTNVAGELYTLAGAGTSNWRLRFSGTMDYAKFAFSGRPTTEYQDTKVVHNCIWVADSRPTGGGLVGQVVRIRKPALGTAHEFVCTAGSLTAATWRMSQQAGIGHGTTANRPVPNANDIGLQYMDTTLDADGKPIWWNGTAWVDATGLAV